MSYPRLFLCSALLGLKLHTDISRTQIASQELAPTSLHNPNGFEVTNHYSLTTNR